MKKIAGILSVLLAFAVQAEEPFYFGACIHNGNETGDIDTTIPLFDELGLNAVRDERLWQFVEWNKGEIKYFKNGKIERMYKHVTDKGGAAINIYAYGHSGYCGKDWYPKTPEAIEAFCKYVDFVANETKDIVKYQQVWNEFDTREHTDTYEGHLEYVNILKAAAPRIRKADPDAKIMGTSSTMIYKLENFLKAGGLKYIDILSIHPYVSWRGEGKDDPEYWVDVMNRFHKVILKYNKGKDFPVFITELGWPAATAGNQQFSEQQQAEYMAQVLCMIRFYPWVKGVTLYDFQNDNIRPGDHEANYGFMRADGTPKPLFYIVRDLSRLVRFGKFVRRVDAGDPKVWIMLYKLDGKDVIAMWNFYKDKDTQVILKNENPLLDPLTVHHAGTPSFKMPWGRMDWWKNKRNHIKDEIRFTLRGMPLILEGDFSQVKFKKPIENIDFPREVSTQKEVKKEEKK